MTVRVEGLGSAVPAAALELRGRSLIVTRLVWAIMVAQGLVLYAISVPVRFSQLAHPPADVQAQLTHAGLPADLYAAYLTALSLVSALVGFVLAALIVWHLPRGRIGLLASLYLATSVNPPEAQSLVRAYPGLSLPVNLSFFLGLMLLIAFFFLFPDGRFVPRWARTPALLYGATGIFIFFLTGASVVENQPGWLGLMTALGGIAGIAAQIYRYLRVSDPIQRQQTKWVMLGVSGAMGTSFLFTFLGSQIPTIGRAETGYDLTSVTVLTLAFLFVPVTLGFAILRYRLWDIDIVINRALVYGALTVGLAGLYLIAVSGIDMVFQSHGHLQISLLATALVAALFAPLRGRLQTSVNRLMYGEREEPYRALTRLGQRVGGALTPAAVLPAVADTVATALRTPYAAITLKQAGGFTPVASHGAFDGAPIRLPLEYQGETVGELLVAPRGPGEEFSPSDRRLLHDLASQVGPAAHAVRLTADLQRSRERLVTAREEERRRLRRDLHDGLGPQLAALTLKIETVRNRFGAEPALDAALIDLTARTQAALADIRRVVYGLRPPALDELGLLSAIRQAAAQYGHPGDGGVRLTVDIPESLPPLSAAVEVAAYCIVQEALTNVVRHSVCSVCRVRLWVDEAHSLLRLEIEDNGRGLPDDCMIGVGLTSMRDRARELGGSCTVVSLPAGGTRVAAVLPSSLVSGLAGRDDSDKEDQFGRDTHPHR